MKIWTRQLGCLMGLLPVFQPLQALADTSDAFQFFQEEAKVVTAARRPQSIDDIPMAVDVITPEEIKASGATNLWDLMRFRVGMDVLDGRSIDGQRAVVAVRGFPQEYVGNIQVLVDGRSVYEPISGGAYWSELPVQMQDIDHIEIIRGPNAALYGSGAALGVINIITKKPVGPVSASARAFGGNQGMEQSAASLESSVKQLAYRLSYTQQYQDGFPLADGSGTGNDFSRSQKANARVNWTWNDTSQLELFAGGAWNHTGLQIDPIAENDYDQNFQMLKFSEKLGDHSTIELLSSRNAFIQQNTPVAPIGVGQNAVRQYDEEILHRLDWGENHMNTTYGVRYRNAASDSDFLFGGMPPTEELWSGYFNQTIRLPRELTLTGGVSWENSNIGDGGTQTNYQVASLWAPLDNHRFRASYSVAHTIPNLFDTHATNLAGSFLFLGNPNLEPQTIKSYEVGYRGYADQKRLQMDTSLYYIRTRNVETEELTSVTLTPTPLFTFGFDNDEEAIARGVETEVKYIIARGRSIYVNYTYEHISDQTGNEGDVTRNTPAHKVNLGGIAELGYGFSGSLNLGYKDKYFITSDGRGASVAIPAYWRLDVRLAYTLNSYTELFIAGQNLGASIHLEFADGLVVPRTYQGGASIKFGGNK